MSEQAVERARVILPIPDQARHELMAYDARDPDAKFPPVEQQQPPKGALVRYWMAVMRRIRSKAKKRGNIA